jgi:hypothetical protein
LLHGSVACRAASFAIRSEIESIRAEQVLLALRACLSHCGLDRQAAADLVLADSLTELARWAALWDGGWGGAGEGPGGGKGAGADGAS